MKPSFTFHLLLLTLTFSCSNDKVKTEEKEINIAEQPIDTIKIGRKIFYENCVACHHSMADVSLNISGTKLSATMIKERLADTIIHNGLSFIGLEDVKMIRKYLNQEAQY